MDNHPRTDQFYSDSYHSKDPERVDWVSIAGTTDMQVMVWEVKKQLTHMKWGKAGDSLGLVAEMRQYGS